MTPSTLRPTLSRYAAIAAFSLLLTPSLTAQNSGRGFVKAQAGTTLSDFPSGLTAGGGFGVRLTEQLDLFAEAGTVRNLFDYTLLGSRFTLPLRSVVTPFFEIGGGVSQLSSSQTTDLPSPSVMVFPHSPDKPRSSAFLLTATGGIHLAITRSFGLDVAYRYFRISSSGRFNASSQLYAGIIYRF